MPGSSLWLLPPKSHPLTPLLPPLLTRTAHHFTSPHTFLPHITLTSEIPPSTHAPSPQAWLDALPLPAASSVVVKLGPLASEPVFFRKLYARVEKAGVAELGAAARGAVPGFEGRGEAREWVEGVYVPHLSLLYHECPQVGAEGLAEVEKFVREAGINLEGEGDMGGWGGGRVVLVPTDRAIKDWAPIAEREL